MILYDASAFFELLKQETISKDSFILDLGIYEIGNVLWKQKNLLKTIDKNEANKFMEFVGVWESIIRTIPPDDFSKIYEIAERNNTTFYDSAYIHFAKKYALNLLTCDEKLYKTAKKNKIQATLIKEKK